MKRRARQKKLRAGRSLNLILWFAFTLFALVIILLFLALQSLLIGIQYRDETLTSMKRAGADAADVLASHPADPVLWREVRNIEEAYDVRIRILAPDGSVIDSNGYGDEKYPEIVEQLKNKLAEGEDEVVVSDVSSIGYVTAVRAQPYYLYLSSSIARIHALESNLRWFSLAAALFSVVLAFVASGFVAMLITKPVTEVTERAKELARGHFDLDFKRDYYCMEIAELSDALDYAREEISKADAMQKELIANVSHDFKTPLTMIKAYASMIAEISGEDKEKRNAHAKIIIDEADRLTSLVEDVLDLSKLRAGVGVHAPAVFNLSDLVYMIAERFDYLRETQGYNFVMEIEEEQYAFADRERIGQVIYNLISNAVNYTGADKRVTVCLKGVEGGARLEVGDTGAGIPPEQLEHIWDRYYRLQETHKLPVQGTGLGLSIVKGILVRQGCPFGALSQLGKGSTFWVEFPQPPEDRETGGASGEGRGEKQA